MSTFALGVLASISEATASCALAVAHVTDESLLTVAEHAHPERIFAVALRLAALLDAAMSRSHCAALLTPPPRSHTNCRDEVGMMPFPTDAVRWCCAGALLRVRIQRLHRRSRDVASKDGNDDGGDDDVGPHEEEWCGQLLARLQHPSASPLDIDTASLCIARLQDVSRAAQDVVNASMEALVSVGDVSDMPLTVAVTLLSKLTAVLGNAPSAPSLVHQAKPSESAETVTETHQSLASRLRDQCFLALRRDRRGDELTATRILRHVLIPLLDRDAIFRSESLPACHQLSVALFRNAQFSDALVLIAALFDVYFPGPPIPPLYDLRRCADVWALLRAALAVVPLSNEDPSKAARLHQHAMYVMKRIVAYTEEEHSCAATSKSSGRRGGPRKTGGAAAPRGTQSAQEGVDGANNSTSRGPGLSTPSDLAVVYIDDVFVWYPAADDRCEKAWNSFFLIFEALAEFGLHIVTPLLAKIEPLRRTGLLPDCWIEVLLCKAVSHPNTGVRKIALKCLWSAENDIAHHLSSPFLFHMAFLAAADPKMVVAIDRVVLPGSFLDCKAAEGSPSRTLPLLEPAAAQLERFYARILGHLAVGPPQASAIHALLRSVLNPKIPRFTICVALRVLCFCGNTLPAASTRQWLTDALLVDIHSLLVDVIRDHMPPWLEARAHATLADFLFTITSEHDFVDRPAVRRVVSLLGVGGDAGGKGLAAIDQTGNAGPAGSALPQRYLIHRWAGLRGLRAPSLRTVIKLRADNAGPPLIVATDAPPRAAATAAEQREVMKPFDDASIVHVVRLFLERQDPDAAELKCLLAGWIPYDQGGAPLIAFVASTVQSLTDRSYVNPRRLATAFLLFSEVTAALAAASPPVDRYAEVRKADGGGGTTPGIPPPRSPSNDGFSAAAIALVASLALSTIRTTLDAVATEAVIGSLVSVAEFDREDWYFVRTEVWDTVLAALYRALTSLARLADWPASIAIATIDLVLAKLSTVESLRRANGIPACTYARLVLVRNMMRVCDVFAAAEMTLRGEPHDQRVAAGDTVGVEEPSPLDGPHLAASWLPLLASLQKWFPRLDAPDIPCFLTSQTWSVIADEAYRCRVQCLSHWLDVFARRTAAALGTTKALDGATTTTTSTSVPNKDATSPAALIVQQVGAAALDMLDSCSPRCVACVADLIFVVFQCGGYRDDAAMRDTVLRTLSTRVSDGLRREMFRGYAVLAFLLVEHIETSAAATELLEVLLDAEGGTDVSERVTYFIAQACLSRVVRGDKKTSPSGRGDDMEARTTTTTSHDDRLWTEHIGPLMTKIALFSNTSNEDDEFEASLAVLEPALVDWHELRRTQAPTVRMASVGRCAALSALVYYFGGHRQELVDFVLMLLDWNITHPIMANEPCMPNAPDHRARIRQWQLLCVLAPLIPTEHWGVVHRDVFLKVMGIANSGSVRRLIEVFTIYGMSQSLGPQSVSSAPPAVGSAADLSLRHLVEALTMPNGRAQVNGSVVLIAVHVLMWPHHSHFAWSANGRSVSTATEASQPQAGGEGSHTFHVLFPLICRHCASHQHVVRLIAQIGFYEVATLLQRVNPQLQFSAEAAAILNFVTTSPDSEKARVKHRCVVVYDDVQAIDPTDILCVQRKEGEHWLIDAVPVAFFERVRHAEAELVSILGGVTPHERHRCRMLGAPTCEDLAVLRTLDRLPSARGVHQWYLDYTVEALAAPSVESHGHHGDIAGHSAQTTAAAPADANADANAAAVDANVQRKVSSWWQSEVHNELHPRALGIRKRQPIVVVTTLLDNPVNIAGLCRCAEIFAIESIVVPDKKVFQHPHFVAVARSAELWLPWQEVVPSDLTRYLASMKLSGYRIVGIEQTAESSPLNAYRCPERSVLVLGSEGQGIPAAILPWIDECVEIPQYGLIRSLNVHATGAIALYEFTKQLLMDREAEVANGTADNSAASTAYPDRFAAFL
mgnify:CR=1 FL=1